MKIRSLMFVVAALLAQPVFASGNTERPLDARILGSEGFLNGHPDLKFRQSGLKAYEEGDFPQALKLFKRAARYADKPSQGMVAEMLWRGEGVEKDRPTAYAWMDLAAERHFRVLLIQRETYWASLSEDERKQAIAIGQTLYAEYGDTVAKRRQALAMRRAKSQSTGSRTGAVGNLQISFDTPGGPVTIDGSTYYHPQFWEPERYWAWQEKQWKDPPTGVVEIGPLRSAGEAAPDPGKATE